MVNQDIHFFDGLVSHKRFGRKRHEFKYKYTSLYVSDIYDFDAQEIKIRRGSFWSYGSIQSLETKRIINKINEFCLNYNLKDQNFRVDLFKIPDMGSRQAFNPVCFWFLVNRDKCLLFIAQVTNTFQEKQCYEVSNCLEGLSPYKWYEVEKKMYVSPFTEKRGFYKFKICLAPFHIRISQFNPSHDTEIITAIRGRLDKLEGRLFGIRLIKLFYNSLLVVPRIHLQALLLWVKRFPVFPHGDSGYVD